MNTNCRDAAKRTSLETLHHGSGFRFSGEVLHSWCARRAVNEGLLTLSILRDDVRLTLLAGWMRSADSLLDFIARRLPDRSAELAVCRFEQLTLRAHQASRSFKAPVSTSIDSRQVLQRSDAAGMAFFQEGSALLVAPGLSSLYRVASAQEERLWVRLATPTGAAALIEESFPQQTIVDMLWVGALTLAC